MGDIPIAAAIENLSKRIAYLEKQILEINNAWEQGIMMPDEAPDVCDACHERNDFIQTYVIQNAPSDDCVGSRHEQVGAAEDTVCMAVACWDAIQNEREGHQ